MVGPLPSAYSENDPPWKGTCVSRTHSPRTTSLTDVVCGSLDPSLTPVVRESVEFFLSNLDASMALGDPSLLAAQIRWQTRRLAVLSPEIDVDRLAAVTQEAITESLRPGEAAAAADHLAAALHQARELRRAGGRATHRRCRPSRSRTSTSPWRARRTWPRQRCSPPRATR